MATGDNNKGNSREQLKKKCQIDQLKRCLEGVVRTTSMNRNVFCCKCGDILWCNHWLCQVHLKICWNCKNHRHRDSISSSFSLPLLCINTWNYCAHESESWRSVLRIEHFFLAITMHSHFFALFLLASRQMHRDTSNRISVSIICVAHVFVSCQSNIEFHMNAN